jgi:hypothetical protein
VRCCWRAWTVVALSTVCEDAASGTEEQRSSFRKRLELIGIVSG